MARILIVDDERSANEYLRLLLDQEGYDTCQAGNGVEALVSLEEVPVDLVITDLNMPEMDGLELLAHIRQRWPRLPVIVITAASEVEDIVDVVKRGATNYLVKPTPPPTVIGAVERALDVNLAPPAEPGGLSEIIGASRPIVEVRHRAALAAASDVPILIVGETGTGKELVARAIHSRSALAKRPFVAHNCAAVPRELFESVFFGHRRGSFTGADRDHAGLLEEANGGVLFLDELETLDPMHQAKLLRVLDDGEVRPVGGDKARRVSVRFIAATNRDPQRMIAEGSLREDIYYRLRGFEIAMPLLRERASDIPLLANHFLGDHAPGFTPEALEAMSTARWPGNVRQLLHAVRSARAVAGEGPVQRDHLPPECVGEVEWNYRLPSDSGRAAPSMRGLTLKEVERQAILQALEDCGGNRSKAARLLDIDRSTLRRKLQEFGIDSKR